MLAFMLLPIAACLILALIHAYLGLHVLTRGVIFVDLALAQLAALGALVGYALGWPFHTMGSYFFSLGFTLLGALFFALSRYRHMRVPHEGIIGIVYAVAAAVAILILNFIPAEAEHLKHMLVGNLLYVDQGEVIKLAIMYGCVGLIHYLFRRPFWAVSRDDAPIPYARVWDFLFYATFGVVVTSSVEIAGVLLVFAYLIIPSVCAFLVSDRLKNRLIVAWGVGIFASAIGILTSVRFDLPTGPAIICTLGVMVGLAGLFSLKRAA